MSLNSSLEGRSTRRQKARSKSQRWCSSGISLCKHDMFANLQRPTGLLQFRIGASGSDAQQFREECFQGNRHQRKDRAQEKGGRGYGCNYPGVPKGNVTFMRDLILQKNKTEIAGNIKEEIVIKKANPLMTLLFARMTFLSLKS